MKSILAIVVVSLSWGCLTYWYIANESKWFKEPTPVIKQETPPVEPSLTASRELQEIFPVLKGKALKGEELERQFEKMNWLGNHACNILYNREPNIEETKKAFSPTLYNGLYSRLITLLISGCHNFFRMNDVFITQMTDKINEIYGNEEKACYSVGFTQIYIFATRIHCKEITAIDLDWRILWGHFQMMKRLLKHDTPDYSSLRIGWSADYAGQIKETEPKVSINTFCYTTDTKNCKKAFEGFHDVGVQKLELQLAFLHQIHMKSTARLGFIYTSNAIDPGYTSQKQFDELLLNVKNQMSFAKKVVIAYHSGGNQQFGIYELTLLQPDSLQVRTVCRDSYSWSSSYSTRGKEYDTYLDKLSVTQEAEECSK